jgi:hypothetical protein
MQPTLFPETFLSKTAHAAQLPNPHPMQPNISCSPHYFQKLFYQKQLMQPNCQIPTLCSPTSHAAHTISRNFSIKNSSCSPTCSYFQRLFYQKQLMQLFPTTFLSKTAHAAQLPNPHPMQPNISCSPHYFQKLFYQKQLMQPNMQLFPTTFLSKTAHAAISNDFSIKNSSCSYFQ